MIRASYKKYTLRFKSPSGTSRGVLLTKDSYFVLLRDDANPEITGIGECSILPGLSPDDRPGMEAMLSQSCRLYNGLSGMNLDDWPAIRAGFEMAELDLVSGGNRLLFPSAFTEGTKAIPVNGLIWMGDPATMLHRIDEKLSQGFRVIKIKIGAVDFADELRLIKHIRRHFSVRETEIRLDANGAFSFAEASEKLKRLSELDIHSVEQPIRAGQTDAMAELCRLSPVPVALDEELIGISNPADKKQLLETIRPQFIILKPSLTGGFEASQEWIGIAGNLLTGWWVTSALESNIGLNAIAQWTATLGNPLPQGLGTGSLYTNNIPSPLLATEGWLWHRSGIAWDVSPLL